MNKNRSNFLLAFFGVYWIPTVNIREYLSVVTNFIIVKLKLKPDFNYLNLYSERKNLLIYCWDLKKKEEFFAIVDTSQMEETRTFFALNIDINIVLIDEVSQHSNITLMWVEKLKCAMKRSIFAIKLILLIIDS
jgi:hypothetical protein